MKDISIDRLASAVTNRSVSFFQNDFDSRHTELEDRIRDRRVLVIGGAGSIGSATVRLVSQFGPSVLHVVDQNENDLAELVRFLRNQAYLPSSTDFRTLPLDFGSELMHRFLIDEPPYDFVLNFAALKHVRSEKDVYSLLRMFDVNLVKAARFLGWISQQRSACRYFCVSTDKAANPVNLMGASKRLMEDLIFSREILTNPTHTASSARFANVAFSKGSLLESFLKRLENRQPLAAPKDTLRYFISPYESGQICLLATFLAPDGHLLVPTFDPGSNLVDLETVAVRVLDALGLEPRIYEDETLARRKVETDMLSGSYPLLLTPLDTSGEKPYEEFVGNGEKTADIGMTSVQAVKHDRKPIREVMSFIETIDGMIMHPETSVTKSAIVENVRRLLPNFEHIETGRSLDEKV